MVDDGATIEDIKDSVDEAKVSDKSYLNTLSGSVKFEDNPLQNIDFARAVSINNATFNENKKLKDARHTFRLKNLLLQYVMKYVNKWMTVIEHPKQIKQKPAWFDLALSKFKENELSSDERRRIKEVFNALWEYRDRHLPERVMSEEESTRQYGINSPYYEQPEASMAPQTPTYGTPDIAPTSYPEPTYTIEQPVQQPSEEDENPFGIRKIQPSGDTYLSEYITPVRRTSINVAPSAQPLVKPQGAFTMGMTQGEKNVGGSGGGAFSIGQNMLSGIRGSGGLKQVLTQKQPNLPQQPIQVVPNETITVAQQPPVMQRAQKSTAPSLNRKGVDFKNMGLAKFRNIELPTIGSSKVVKKKKSGLHVIKKSGFELPNLSSNKKSGFELPNIPMKLSSNKKSGFELPNLSTKSSNKKSGLSVISKKRSGVNISPIKIKSSIKLEKGSVNNMSHDIRKSVGSVVGGINNLKKQVRGEFKSGSTLSSINIKNIKSNKNKGHKDLDVLKKLKMETHNQISREALECKMIPRLKEQCDKVFSRNQITNEVSKFRNDFKDISKMVPTVKGDKATISEISMVGKSIAHGVDGAHVADVRSMYKNSGATKQMNVGMMEYDYSFVTGKKKRQPIEEYYEEE